MEGSRLASGGFDGNCPLLAPLIHRNPEAEIKGETMGEREARENGSPPRLDAVPFVIRV